MDSLYGQLLLEEDVDITEGQEKLVENAGTGGRKAQGLEGMVGCPATGSGCPAAVVFTTSGQPAEMHVGSSPHSPSPSK